MRLASMMVVLLACGCGNTSAPQDMAMSDLSAGTDLAGFQSLAPCVNLGDYVTGATTIVFGGTTGNNFSPKCLQVSAGTMVTFSGDFSSHPLTPSTRGTSGNPVTSTNTGTTKVVTYANPGFFPYFCNFHGDDAGTGMAGVVHVVP